MEAIEKMRSIVNWANNQSEYLNYKFKTIQQIEKAYNYADKNNLSFLDDDYLYSECDEKTRVNALKFIQNLTK
jgi:hypothetical protein